MTLYSGSLTRRRRSWRWRKNTRHVRELLIRIDQSTKHRLSPKQQTRRSFNLTGLGKGSEFRLQLQGLMGEGNKIDFSGGTSHGGRAAIDAGPQRAHAYSSRSDIS